MEKIYLNQDTRHIALIQRNTIIGMLVNILLSVTKFIFGILGHSQAVVADAVHSLSDLSTDLAVLFGVRVWSKPADDDHPYGHGRIETIVTIGISLVLLLVGVGIAYHALVTIHDNTKANPRWIALWGAILSIVLKEILYRWTLNVGKRVHSRAVMANAWHHRSDVLSSIPVVIAVMAAAISPDWAFLDLVGAIVVSLFILHTGWRVLWSALEEVADRGISKRNQEKIKTLVLATPGVRSCHALRTRRMGLGWYVDLHIQVAPQMTVQEGHGISERVKANLLESGQNIIDVLVHLEPEE